MEVTMAEFRKQLTERQFASLINAQLRFERANDELTAADRHLVEVTGLIRDAFGFEDSLPIRVDPQTRELVVTTTTEEE
jgi:hypothetical protein